MPQRDAERKPTCRAVTLVELVMVIGILGVLMTVLLPAIGRARELARIAGCMANQRSLAQGVHAFAYDHLGYGQLMAYQDFWKHVPNHARRYAFERDNPVFQHHRNHKVLSPWPVAYGPYIGAGAMRGDEYFVPDYAPPETALNQRDVPLLRCPSDRHPVGNVLFPSPAYGVLSYSVNLDIFGTVWNWKPYEQVRVWRKGANVEKPLEGHLDRVRQPSRVVLFVDGGSFLPSPSTPRYISSQHLDGGTLSAFAAQKGWLPANRHGHRGDLVAVMVDGHAAHLRPTRSAISVDSLTVDGADQTPVRHADQRHATHYSPNPRITPFEPYDLLE